MEEYIVTLKKGVDIEKFYDDMETVSGCDCIPNREVICSDRRPVSRNTGYLLTNDEAELIKNDERVIDVTPKSLIDSIQIKPCWTQTSSEWDKSSTAASTNRNWGLHRCVRGTQVSNWGSNGTASVTATVTTTSSGKNVDIVIVDGHLNPDHPEFAVKLDGTGGSRVQQFNWFSLTNQVTGGSNGEYVYRSGSALNNSDDNHGQHVAGIVAGNSQGWARDANIYYLSPYDGQISNQYLFDYIRVWHNNKAINPVTGRKNPTIVNNSWNGYNTLERSKIILINHRGNTYVSFTDSTLQNTLGIRNFTSTHIYPSSYSVATTSWIADMEDCVDDRIIFVGAAGNESEKIDVQGGLDYNNYIYYNNGVSYYYHRGSWNTSAAVSGVGGKRLTICVGSISSLVNESKSTFSNCGPRVDVYAPGTNIISSLQSDGAETTIVNDHRDSLYKMGKYNGTSMASPQVCGVIACLLEQKPTMNQTDVLNYLKQHYKKNQITTTSGGYVDDTDLQGSVNAYLFYYKERPISGVAFPKVTIKPRLPSTNGIKFPRVNSSITKRV